MTSVSRKMNMDVWYIISVQKYKIETSTKKLKT